MNEANPQIHLYSGRSARAVCAIEVVLVLPILLICLVAVIEFGLILANSKHVAMASRAGAKVAAESTAPFTGATMLAIRTAVDRQLESAGLGPDASLGVALQHNVVGGGASPQSIGFVPSALPAAPPLPSDGDGAVRVTVYVALPKLAPNFLSIFGFDISDRRVALTTTYPRE